MDILRNHHRRSPNIKQLAGTLDFSHEHFARPLIREHGQLPANTLRKLRQTVMPVHAMAE